MKHTKKKSVSSPWIFLLPVVAIILAAAVRFAALDERTIHIDEGMGIRASQQALEGAWKFYPANGHGPTLFYAGAIIRVFFGDSIVAARALTSVAGIATITFLFLALRRDLGLFASTLLAGFLGFSSGMTFYNAYFIHESFFLLFTACAYLSARSWFVRKRALGVGGFFVSLALMYATKETAILTVFAWVVAGTLTWFFFLRSERNSSILPSAGIVLTAIMLALFTHLILFSSFFGNPQGIIDSFTAPFHWAERAQVMHARPLGYFLSLLATHEFALAALAAILTVLVTLRKKWNAELAFLAAWFVAITLTYSFISYKTPWCVPNMILPLAIFTAFAAARVWPSIKALNRKVFLLGTILLFAAGAARMTEDVFLHPDREFPHDYAYLQSDASLRMMIKILYDLSAIDGRGASMPLQVAGNADELIYVLTDRYERSFQPFAPNLPAYVNYQNDADAFAALLRDSSQEPYVRLIFTYIQHVNQIDMFVKQSLWDEYRQSGKFVAPQGMDGEAYDYR